MNVLNSDQISRISKEIKIKGVAVSFPQDAKVRKGNYFDCFVPTLSSQFKSRLISSNLLITRNGSISFTQIETHNDCEIFHFLFGESTMIFADVADEKILEESVKTVRIPQGTILTIDANKGHFIGPSITQKALCTVVYSVEADVQYYPLDQK